MKQIATFDTSFWINCHRSDLLRHVLNRYDLRYTKPVGSELQERFPSGREFWRLAGDGVVAEVRFSSAQVRLFGDGERSVIEVAIEHPEWVLLIDDRRPFDEAARLGLKAVCSPVLAIDLFEQGILSAADTLLVLARLAALQTVSPQLLAAALAQLGRSPHEEV